MWVKSGQAQITQTSIYTCLSKQLQERMLSNPLGLQKCTFLHKTGTGRVFVEVTVFWKMSLMIALLIGLRSANKSCSSLFFSTFPVYDLTNHGDYVILAVEENVVFFNFWDAFFMVERLIKKGKIQVVLPQCLMWLLIKNFD